MELVNNCGHDVEDLGFACVRHIAVIVNEDGLKQRRHHVGIDHFKVIRLFHICINEFQNLLLDRPEAADFGGFGGNAPYLTSVLIIGILVTRSFSCLPSLATASLMSWLDARYMFNMSW